MHLLHRYIGKTIAQATGLAIFLLFGIEVFFAFVNELRYIGTGDYGLPEAITYLILQTPQRIYQMFPMSILLGSILGLGALASNSELVAMRASGISYLQITGSALRTGLSMACIAVLIGEGLAPASDRLAQHQRAFCLSGGQAMMTPSGTWMRDGDDFIHVRTLHMHGGLEGITRYHFDEDLHLKTASFAQEGTYQDDHWVLYNIQETHFEADQVTSTHFKQKNWDSVLDPEMLRVVGVKYLEQLSLPGLWRTIAYRQQNGLEFGAYELAFWEKIVQPIITLIMMFLGIMCIFGPLRQVNMGLRTVVGILIGFAFHILNRALGPLSLVLHVPPLIGATLPALLFLGVGVLLLVRVR